MSTVPSAITWREVSDRRCDGRLAAGGQDLPVVEVRGPEPGPTLGVIAGVHGDEVECIDALGLWLNDITPDRGRVLAVPVCHPAALAAGTRVGPDGVDLNRVFPGDPDGGQTERLARVVVDVILPELDLLLTLHSWSRSGETVTYVEYPLPGTGEAAVVARSRELAHAVGAAYAEGWDWPRGLLPAAAVRAGVPSAELEVGGLGRATARGRGEAIRALDGAARFAGVVAGTPWSGAADVHRHWLTATTTGRAAQRCERGATVAQGDLVAEVHDLHGRCLQQLTATEDGVVAIHVTHGRVEPGDPIAVVFARDRRQDVRKDPAGAQAR
jgi:predicted deacylase